MRYVIATLLLGLIIFPGYVYADGGKQFGYKIIPSKMMENTEGILQVYSTAGGTNVDKLIATSSDSSILQILGTEQDSNHFVSSVKVKAVGAGTVQIALAATGFSSLEFPLTVYTNSEAATKLLIKTTPSTFSTNGPTHGYIAVEITNNDGFPTIAQNDIPVTITTSDSTVLSPRENTITIKQGSYYGIGQFDVSKGGTAQITASSPSMQPVSSTITVNNVSSQSTIQVYVYPQTLNALHGAYSYVIVQLHDSSGVPLITKADIPVSVQITNATGIESINTSGQSPLVQLNDGLVIKKGSYWGYAPLEATAGKNGTYNINISAKGYLVSPPAQFKTIARNVLLDDKTAMIDMLPVLATGNMELVGVLHLQDSSKNPVIANNDLQIHADSSDQSTFSIPSLKIDHGSQAALVFAQVGSTVNPVTLNVITEPAQTIVPNIIATSTNAPTLVTDTLIPKILTHTSFPLALYLTSSSALTSFSKDFNVLISPQQSIKIASTSISKGQDIFLTDATLLLDGTQNISVVTPDYSASTSIQGLSTKPSSLFLDHPDQMIANTNSVFSIELFDAQQNPVVAEHDTTIQLVSSDPSVLAIPDSVQINKGSYYATFAAQIKDGGNAELAVLSDEIPLAKFPVQVISFVPQVSIDSTDRIDQNYPFVATITATYQQSPLSDLKVDWKVTGAQIQSMDSVTDKDGKAKISLVSTDPASVNIQTTVSGGSYQTASATKQVSVNPPLVPVPSTSASSSTTPPQGFTIMGMSPLIFVIPVAAVAAFIVLKKREMLEGITQKINMGKFSEIKERVTALREK